MARGIGIGDEVAINGHSAQAGRRGPRQRQHTQLQLPPFDPRSHDEGEARAADRTRRQRHLCRRARRQGDNYTGPPVTVDIDKVRLVQAYVPPKRKKPLRDMAH